MSNPYPGLNSKKHMVNLALGDKVTFTHYLRRLRSGEHREWSNTEMKEAKEGYIVGKRTIQNGAWGWESWLSPVSVMGEELGMDAEVGWMATDKITYLSAYLISFSLRRKPVYVLPEYITKLYAQTVVTHHFNPDEPNVDTIHTFGSNDGGATWEIVSEERLERPDFAKNMKEMWLDELVRESQEVGDYD